MSNPVTLEATTFTDSNGIETYGYRAYDSYGMIYDDSMDKFDMQLKGLDFLDKVLENGIDQDLQDMLHHAGDMEFNQGLTINGDYFESADLQEVLKKHNRHLMID